MRRQLFITVGLLGFIALAATAATVRSGNNRNAIGERVTTAGVAADDNLIVHEWGTFTSFSGSDGVALEFRPLEDQDLPPFVLDRIRWSGEFHPFLFSKGAISAFQRMETPVTYFYTERPQRVSVRVNFPDGLLTELYPPVTSIAPPVDANKPEPMSNTSFEWRDVLLLPEQSLAASTGDEAKDDKIRREIARRLIPHVDNRATHYGHARNTDSALVVVDRLTESPGSRVDPSTHGMHFEKFLFYRGLGNFKLPVKAESSGGGEFIFRNNGNEPIRSLFLVSRDDAGIRFRRYEQVGAQAQLTLEMPSELRSVEELAESVSTALTAEGLYEKEARAMVDTWRDSWFDEYGTRVFYLLPQSITDELLPLTVEPRPDAMVRVMVGRMELLSREDETRIIGWLQERVDARIAAQEKELPIETLPHDDDFRKLGRMAEPALVRIRHLNKSADIMREAMILLSQLRSANEAEPVEGFDQAPADGLTSQLTNGLTSD